MIVGYSIADEFDEVDTDSNVTHPQSVPVIAAVTPAMVCTVDD